MKIDDKLSDVFDVEPMEVLQGDIITVNNEVVPAKEPGVSAADQDFDNTRSNLYTLMQSGEEALMHALQVAKQSEHPNAFAVVGNLMKQLSEVNEKLMKLHERKQYMDNTKGGSGGSQQGDAQATGGNVTNNAIFVGSTTDLNKMLNNMLKGEQ